MTFLSRPVLWLALALSARVTATTTASQPRDLALNAASIASIDREARAFTGRGCSGHYKVTDMFAGAGAVHLQVSHETATSLFGSQLKRFPGASIKQDFKPGKVSRVWFDLSRSGAPSAFVMQALQDFQGAPHIISYGCWLK